MSAAVVRRHKQNNIELNLDLLALDLTNDPNPVRFDGVPPEHEPEKVMVASLVDMPGLLMHSVVAQTPGESIYYYINDHLGTPQKMIDDNGAIFWSADYEPFGEASVTVNTVTNNFRFPGQYYDSESGLHYNWYRYYGPGIGRYLRADPIGLNGGINLYLYVQNNPVNRMDPNGLSWATFKCKVLKFGDELHCRVTNAVDYSDCASQVIVTRTCYEQADRRYERCMKKAEKDYKRCMCKAQKP